MTARITGRAPRRPRLHAAPRTLGWAAVGRV